MSAIGSPALSRSVGDVATFFERYWAQAPLLRRAGGSDFDDLASFDDLDRMVSSLALRASSLRMVKGGAALSPSSYTSAPAGKRASEAVVNAPLVYELYADGATIVLESLHRYWEPLTNFCRDLELDLGHRLQVNAYITPPGSQGFDVHRDDHDVFVLQVSGEKHWTVFDRDDPEAVIIDESITKGSALYVPKGFPHSARTGAGSSAHLTVGILTHETIEIVKEITKLAEGEERFKQRLDLASTSDGGSFRRAVEQGIDDLRLWLDKIDIDELTGRMARRIKASQQPLFRGQLRQLEAMAELGADSSVQRRRGATCFLLAGDSYLTAVLPDRELQMPLVAESAMHKIATSERFVVADLHPSLDPEGALILVRRLIREGLLEAVLAD